MDFVPRRKKLLPSQAAVADITQGMAAYGHDAAAGDEPFLDGNGGRRSSNYRGDEPFLDGMGGKRGGATAGTMPEHGTLVQPRTGPGSVQDQKMKWLKGLQGVSNAFAQMPSSAPVQHAPMFMDDKPVQLEGLPSLLRGLKNGGFVEEGERVRVGEDGEEDLIALPNGGAVVIPEGKTYDQIIQPQFGEIRGGEQYGETQTDPQLVQKQGLPSDALITPQFANVERDERRELEQRREPLDRASEQAMVVKNNKWKDFGYGLLQGLNNALNRQNNPIQSWGEKKRDARVAPIAQKIALIKNRQAEMAAQDAAALDRRIKTAQAKGLEGKPAADAAAAQAERLTQQEQQVLGVYKDFDDFDPVSNPQHKAIVDNAPSSIRHLLVPRKKGDAFTFTVAPDGRLITGNTRTGESKIGGDTFVRPVKLTSKDITDLFTDLPSDSEMTIRAQANVGELPTGRKVRENVLVNLPAQFKNPDGTLNEVAYWQAASEGAPRVDEDGIKRGTGISPNELYENLPSDYTQRLARAKLGIANQFKTKRAEVARLGRAVEGQQPLKTGGQKVSARQIQDRFNAILNIKDAKKRGQQLNDLYRSIEEGYINVY